MKRKNLVKITNEGFVDTGKTAGMYNIYELETVRVFYDKYKDRIVCRFDLNDLMTKL